MFGGLNYNPAKERPGSIEIKESVSAIGFLRGEKAVNEPAAAVVKGEDSSRQQPSLPSAKVRCSRPATGSLQ